MEEEDDDDEEEKEEEEQEQENEEGEEVCRLQTKQTRIIRFLTNLSQWTGTDTTLPRHRVAKRRRRRWEKKKEEEGETRVIEQSICSKCENLTSNDKNREIMNEWMNKWMKTINYKMNKVQFQKDADTLDCTKSVPTAQMIDFDWSNTG